MESLKSRLAALEQRAGEGGARLIVTHWTQREDGALRMVATIDGATLHQADDESPEAFEQRIWLTAGDAAHALFVRINCLGGAA